MREQCLDVASPGGQGECSGRVARRIDCPAADAACGYHFLIELHAGRPVLGT